MTIPQPRMPTCDPDTGNLSAQIDTQQRTIKFLLSQYDALLARVEGALPQTISLGASQTVTATTVLAAGSWIVTTSAGVSTAVNSDGTTVAGAAGNAYPVTIG